LERRGATCPEVYFLYASPLSHPPINYRAEVEAIQEAFADAQTGVKLHVGVATAESLSKILILSRMRKGLVLHLSAHGTWSEEKGIGLVLESAAGRPHVLWRKDLEEIIGINDAEAEQNGSLSLLFLSACWSQEMAQVFIECGCPHVVSLRTRVSDAAARRFAQRFYLSLAVGMKLRPAWEKARTGLCHDPDQTLAEQSDRFLLFGQQGADRATLDTLCGSVLGAKEFSIRQLEGAEAYLNLAIPPRVVDFVGRLEEIHTVLSKLERHRGGVVYGPEGIGKTALALELAHFASAPGRFFSCSSRIVTLESDKVSHVVAMFEEALEKLEELHVPMRLWSGSAMDSSFGSRPPSSRCSNTTFDDSASFDEHLMPLTTSDQEDVALLLHVRQRLRQGFQRFEKKRRGARTLLIVDDQAGVIRSSSDLRQLLGELLDNTYRLHILVCSREPIYEPFGQTRADNVSLAGLGEQDSARLLLRRVHRLLLPTDFVSPENPGQASIIPADCIEASPTASPSPGGTGGSESAMDAAIRRLRGHALLKGLGGNPGLIRAAGARVHDGGPTLAEIAASMLQHEISSASPMYSRRGTMVR
jgi:hypothetical protein